MKKLVFNKDQIKKINELFHDIEADVYLEHHPEILDEKTKWEKIGETYFKQNRHIRVLDVGTGDGFVPSIIAKYLKENDTLVCSDISEKMLKKAEERLIDYDKFEKRFVRADALDISKMNLHVDFIIMNSVLHHLPDYEEVLKNFAMLLNKDGFIIIMHERNQRFCKQVPFWQRQYLALEQMNRIARKMVKNMLIFFRLYKKQMMIDELYSKVKMAIKEKGIYDKDLNINEINSLVDIHDPDEGGDGFDPFLLHKRFFNNFEIVELFTDMHLGPWTKTNNTFFKKKIQTVFEKRYPYSGSIFGLIMRKSCNTSL
jgi:ubiquinone/menaquinone biosynthesis C-methylase UbiE